MVRRPLKPLQLTLLTLLALVLFALPALLSTLLAAPREQSPEVRFVREMTQHHAQAVDMATRIRDRSQDRTIRTLALDIMLAQQDQIGQMRGWLTLWNLPWAGQGMTAEHARQMGMATQQEVSSLDTLPTAQAEVKFLQLMKRHHQGALGMVEPVLASRTRPEVQQLATQIKTTQSAEIRLLDTLLQERQAAPLPDPMPMPGGEHQHGN